MSNERQAFDDANRKVKELEAGRDLDIANARSDIAAKYAAKLAIAYAARSKARTALTNATEAAAKQEGHPLQGKRLTRQRYIGSYWSDNCVTDYGEIELATAQTQFPGNLSQYSKPDPGTWFVRLHDKSGKPGKRICTRVQVWEVAQ